MNTWQQLEAEEREEWNADADLARCSWCGEIKLCQPSVDPFVQAGIDEGSHEPVPWCFDCFEQRAMDV